MHDSRGGPPFPAGQDKLRQGFALQQQGRLAEAEAIYRQLLALQPRNAQALHFLGVLKLQSGQKEQGVEFLRQAVAIQPTYAQAHGSLAKAQDALGQRDDAIASYGRLIALMPANAEALYNRGRLLEAEGKLAEALKDYDRVLTLKPAPEPALDRGTVLVKLERPDEALAAFDRAIALRAAYPVAHYNRGLTLMALKRAPEALAAYDRAITLKVDYAEAHCNRGMALEALDRDDEALAAYDRALALNPAQNEAALNRGTLLDKLGRHAEALACYNAALSHGANSAMLYNNRSNALRALDRSLEALADLDIALGLDPAIPQVHSNRGLTLQNLKQPADALDSFDRAIALDSDYAEGWFNKSLCLLLMGRFQDGWSLYEWRQKLPAPVGFRPYAQPQWHGEDIAGKTLFVHCEQGLGDTLQFCRYLPLAQARGAQVMLSVQDRLVRLLSDAMPGIAITGAGMAPDHFDYHAPLMSLPLAFGSVADAIPAPASYLVAQPERVAHWREKIGSHGFRIGICWQGSRQGRVDIGRSVSLAAFQGLAALPGVRLISLQKQDGVEQLATLPGGMTVESLGEDFDNGPDAFVDTAAVIENCDLVITVDTSVAHLAGALGRPTWVVLRHVPEWRWQLDGSQSPWYPAMQLFRQPAPGDWGSVFAQLTQALGDHRAGNIITSS